MTCSEASQFQCTACQPPVCFESLSAVEKHFSLVHRVAHLLSSPATLAVALPGNLLCARNSCSLPHHCRLCKPTSKTYFAMSLKKHMETEHGDFFQQRLHLFSTSHCRLCGDVVSCSEEKHKSICPLGAMQWWAEEVGKVQSGEGQDVVESVGDEQGIEVDKMARCQQQWSITDDKEGEMEVGKGQVEDNCIKTLKVRIVARVAGGNAQLRQGDDCKVQQKSGKLPRNGGVENTCEQEEVSVGQVHSIEVSAREASGIIGVAGKNVRRLDNMTGTRIYVKDGVDASKNVVEICGDDEAVEKAAELVNEYLMKNCTNKVALKQHELKALLFNESKFLKQFQRKSDATIILEKQSSSTVAGLRESAKKLKEELDEFFESAQVVLLTQTEKQILLDGGKNCPLDDFF